MLHFAILPHFAPYVIYEELTNYIMKQRNIFSLYMAAARKVRNCSFNLFGNSLLHINTQVLTNHVDKMVEFDALDMLIKLYIRSTNSLLDVLLLLLL